MAASSIPKDERNRIKVIARAASVLRALAGHRQGLGVSELAVEVGLPRTTVHRIVSALQEEDLVSTSATGLARLGPGLLRLAGAEQLDHRIEIRPYLEELSSRLSETVDLAVLDNDSIVCVDQVAAPQWLRAVSALGSAIPAYCSASGKALLASQPVERVHRLLPERLPKRTPNTITSRAKLDAELKRIRGDGYAVDREEYALGVSAVAAVVRDNFGAEMALAVAVPMQRFSGREGEIVDALLETTTAIERQLGAGPD
ncbi:MAG: IclR family transcriptional regulator [Actinobacteria bacterium]|nr:IclR family transcriptional regulator [Actinomycetota bacterium]